MLVHLFSRRSFFLLLIVTVSIGEDNADGQSPPPTMTKKRSSTKLVHKEDDNYTPTKSSKTVRTGGPKAAKSNVSEDSPIKSGESKGKSAASKDKHVASKGKGKAKNKEPLFYSSGM